MAGAEKEIALHGYAGAELKRAAKKLEKNPAQYNYYFASIGKKAVEGVAEHIYLASLQEINVNRIRVIKGLDSFHKHATLLDAPETGQDSPIKTSFEGAPHSFRDLLYAALMPAASYVIELYERTGHSYYARFSQQMFREMPAMYHYLAQKGQYSGIQYCEALAAHIGRKKIEAGVDYDLVSRAHSKLYRMQWVMVSLLETDIEASPELSSAERTSHVLQMIDAMYAYIAPELDEHPRQATTLEMSLLFESGIVGR